MGTRALTRVFDDNGRALIHMYSQYDGYPDGLGSLLHQELGNLKLVNGIGDDTRVANGMGCFAAQVVAALKDGPGAFYLEAPSSEIPGWIEFIYNFSPSTNIDYSNPRAERKILLTVTSSHVNVPLYSGLFSDFDGIKVTKAYNKLVDPESEESEEDTPMEADEHLRRVIALARKEPELEPASVIFQAGLRDREI